MIFVIEKGGGLQDGESILVRGEEFKEKSGEPRWAALLLPFSSANGWGGLSSVLLKRTMTIY